jgi:3-oxoacyl-[acyl-carrier-protein] synthase III
MPTGVLGIVSYVPDQVIGNSTIAAWTGAAQEWISERTGITERRYADAGTPTSDLAVRAVEPMFAADPQAAERIDALVLATCTPDMPHSATSAIVQH